MTTTLARMALPIAVPLVLTLFGCGGGGGSPAVIPDVGDAIPPSVDEETMTPALALPVGHGLMAGEITVQPGATEEHGNVVVSCPAGASACVVSVAADGSATYDRTGGVPSVKDAFASWSFPMDHGLMAGEITVQPGATEEHGNVVVSCPAGGSACVVSVAADGSATYDRTGGVPSVMAAPVMPSIVIEMRQNPSAQDLLDHWNKPEPLRQAMGLSAVSAADTNARKESLGVVIETAATNSADTRARFLNVRAEDVEIIGERDGFTYGQWKGGPAGTLNIEFDWRFAQDIPIDVRAQLERAAKVWARRIEDDFRTYTIEKGRTIRDAVGGPEGSDSGVTIGTFDEEATTDGLLVAVVVTNGTPWAAASFGRLDSDTINTTGDFQPSFGLVYVNLDNPNLQQRWADTVAHEIGHVLGIGSRALSWLHHINQTDHTFAGPRAREANGGNAVPLQWLGPGREPVAPGTSGAERDIYHLGVCNSIVSYACYLPDVLIPTELDFAVLEDMGYEILDSGTASKPELYGYGAWGRYSAWGVSVERILNYDERDEYISRRSSFTKPYRGHEFAADELYAGAEAFGISPATTLSDSPLSLDLGTVTWSGSLIGVDLGHEALPPVSGGASLSISLPNLDGTARFDDLTVIVDGQTSAFRATELQYDVSVTGNAFTDSDGIISGGFYGPGHEEMAGTLQDTSTAINLLAGFGGDR